MLDFNQVRDDAQGRWPGILAALGIRINGNKHGPCPNCGGKDRFRFDDKDGRGTFICNQCGAGDGVELVKRVLRIGIKEVFKEIARVTGTAEKNPILEEKISPKILRSMFYKSNRIKENDEVSRYLYYRGIMTPPKVLRFMENCWEPETRKEHPAMLAIFYNKNGKAITIHRTYLDKHAKKLNIEHPKKIMPPLEKMTGGAARLYDWKSGVLGIAEGIETAIAVSNHEGIPCWAALNATLLEGWEPPKQVKEINIYADNDLNFTGQKAAYVLANKLAMDGFKVRVSISGSPGTDFLDQWPEIPLL